jgi:Predicted transcriptional regulator
MIKHEMIDMKTGAIIQSTNIPVICQKIRYYRKKKGLEQKQLGAMVGVSGNAVTNWEKGRARPDISLIPDLCDILGISFSEIFGMDAPKLQMTEHEKNLIQSYRKLEGKSQEFVSAIIDTLLVKQNQKPLRKIVDLPLYGKSLAAGIGDPSELEYDVEPIYLYDSIGLAHADSVFKVNGDSMEPKFHSDDYVLVERIPDGPRLRFGEIGAFIVGNELYIKEYQEDGLHSLNPNYPVMHFDGDQRVFLIGRVLRVIQENEFASK